jgi:hypothetical protein
MKTKEMFLYGLDLFPYKRRMNETEEGRYVVAVV